MEKLLNELLRWGWKPRGKNYGVVDFLGTLVFVDLNDGRLQSKNALDLRKLTSKESGLRQFLCDKDLIKDESQFRDNYLYYEWTCERDGYTEFNYANDYEYWLIESALRDEDKLEEFLLSNIKVDAILDDSSDETCDSISQI